MATRKEIRLAWYKQKDRLTKVSTSVFFTKKRACQAFLYIGSAVQNSCEVSATALYSLISFSLPWLISTNDTKKIWLPRVNLKNTLIISPPLQEYFLAESAIYRVGRWIVDYFLRARRRRHWPLWAERLAKSARKRPKLWRKYSGGDERIRCRRGDRLLPRHHSELCTDC